MSSLKIGLTGGIGSGKTLIAKIFEILNVPVYYADEATKRLYHTNTQLKEKIKKLFGDEIYIMDELNRKKLSVIVFNDEKKLQQLNDIVHPLTLQDAREWLIKQTAPYVIKEAALIFESGSAQDLDYIIGVHAPLALRIKRVMHREQITETEVINRNNRQIEEGLKMKLCDFVINNDESELVIPQVLQLHKKLQLLASNKYKHQ